MGKTSKIVSHKVATALTAGLKVILCVGEGKRDTSGEFIEFLKSEIRESLDRVPRKYFLNLVVAYEPIWAISDNSVAGFRGETSEDMLEMSIFIRKVLGSICGRDLAEKIPVLLWR